MSLDQGASGWGLGGPPGEEKASESKAVWSSTGEGAGMAGSDSPAREVLYEGPLPVRLTGPSKDETRALTLRLELETPHSASASVSQKVLRFKLTDEKDAFFLQYLNLDEAGYRELRQDQRINCDFAGFPRAFVETVRMCQAGSDARCKYRAEMSTRDRSTVLTFLQVHTFTSIALRLRFVVGDEAALRRHLAEKSELYKRQFEDKERALAVAREGLQRASTQNGRLEREVAQLRLQRKQEVKELELKMQQALTEREKAALQAREALKARIDTARAKERQQWAQKLDAATTRADATKRANAKLSEQLAALKLESDNLRTLAASLKQEAASNSSELKAQRERNLKTDKEFHEAQRRVNGQNVKLAEVQQKIKSSEAIIGELRARGETAEREKKRMDDQLAVYKDNMRAKDERLRAMETDARARALELGKAREEVKELRQRMAGSQRDGADATRRLEARDAQVAALQKQLEEAKAAGGRAGEKNEMLCGTLESEKKKITGLLDEMKKQKSLVEYLQRQLTKYESPFQGRLPISGPDTVTTALYDDGSFLNTKVTASQLAAGVATDKAALAMAGSLPARLAIDDALAGTFGGATTAGFGADAGLLKALPPLDMEPSPDKDLDFSYHDNTSAYFGSSASARDDSFAIDGAERKAVDGPADGPSDGPTETRARGRPTVEDLTMARGARVREVSPD